MNYEEYSKKLTHLKPAREVFVAFLDILGFSEFVRQNAHDDVIAIYQSIFRTTIDLSLTEVAEQRLGDSSWLKNAEVDVNHGELAPKLDNVILNCVTISDSIILSTSGCEMKDFLTLVATVRNLMVRSLYFGFPLRGAIAQGMLTFDGGMSASNSNVIHHQILGLPVVEAASLEKRQNWSGCAIHPSVLDKLGPKIIRLDPLMITFFDVPTKERGGGASEWMPVVNWVHGIADNDKAEFNSEKIRSSFAAHGKSTADIEPMISNTIKFFDEMTQHPVYNNEMTNEEWWSCIESELQGDS